MWGWGGGVGVGVGCVLEVGDRVSGFGWGWEVGVEGWGWGWGGGVGWGWRSKLQEKKTWGWDCTVKREKEMMTKRAKSSTCGSQVGVIGQVMERDRLCTQRLVTSSLTL